MIEDSDSNEIDSYATTDTMAVHYSLMKLFSHVTMTKPTILHTESFWS